MANNMRFAVMALCLAIITPILVGYIYPTDDTPEDTWNISDTYVDAYGGIANADLPNTTQYNGENNNLFLFDPDNAAQPYIRTAARSTMNDTPYMNYRYAGGHWITDTELPYATDANTTAKTLYDLAVTWYQDEYPDTPRWEFVFFEGEPSDTLYFKYNGVEYPQLMVYSNYRALLIDTETGTSVDVTGKTIQYTFQQYVGVASVTAYEKDANGWYVDPAYGFSVNRNASAPASWVNGYVNHGITMMVHIDPLLSSAGARLEFNNQMGIQFYSNGDTVTVSFAQAGSAQQTDVLGDVSVYDHILILVDVDRQTVVIYGLLGMTGFTDNYIEKLGNSLTYTCNTAPFERVDMSGIFTYYVLSTSIESGTYRGIDTATFTPVSYYGDDAWLVKLRAPSVIGDYLTFGDGTDTWRYDLNGNRVTIPTVDNPNGKEFAVRELEITHIKVGDTWMAYINGEQYIHNIENITFGGVWVLGVNTYHMTLTSTPHYGWVAGGFGLDWQGFCLVGLGTCVALFILFGLAYQRKGWADEIGMLMCGICGVFYLVMLFHSG